MTSANMSLAIAAARRRGGDGGGAAGIVGGSRSSGACATSSIATASTGAVASAGMAAFTGMALSTGIAASGVVASIGAVTSPEGAVSNGAAASTGAGASTAVGTAIGSAGGGSLVVLTVAACASSKRSSSAAINRCERRGEVGAPAASAAGGRASRYRSNSAADNCAAVAVVSAPAGAQFSVPEHATGGSSSSAAPDVKAAMPASTGFTSMAAGFAAARVRAFGAGSGRGIAELIGALGAVGDGGPDGMEPAFQTGQHVGNCVDPLRCQVRDRADGTDVADATVDPVAVERFDAALAHEPCERLQRFGRGEDARAPRRGTGKLDRGNVRARVHEGVGEFAEVAAQARDVGTRRRIGRRRGRGPALPSHLGFEPVDGRQHHRRVGIAVAARILGEEPASLRGAHHCRIDGVVIGLAPPGRGGGHGPGRCGSRGVGWHEWMRPACAVTA